MTTKQNKTGPAAKTGDNGIVDFDREAFRDHVKAHGLTTAAELKAARGVRDDQATVTRATVQDVIREFVRFLPQDEVQRLIDMFSIMATLPDHANPLPNEAHIKDLGLDDDANGKTILFALASKMAGVPLDDFKRYNAPEPVKAPVLYPCEGCGLTNPVKIEGSRCPHCQKWFLHDLAAQGGQNLEV